jgi:hypothetical protein
MTKGLPVAPAPGPLEDYAAHFDALFAACSQRQGFRRYLEGFWCRPSAIRPSPPWPTPSPSNEADALLESGLNR